jgi:hypothetical protein
MTTKKQIEANRRNAKLSTGPATAAGRAQSSMNALRHGLSAEKLTVNAEEASQFAALRDGMIEELAPVGALEAELVRRIIEHFWRLRRPAQLEIAHTVHHETTDLGIKVSEGPRYQFMASGSCHNLIRYESSIDRSLQRALHTLERVQARRGEAVATPIALDLTQWADGGLGAPSIFSPPTTREVTNGHGLGTSASTD